MSLPSVNTLHLTESKKESGQDLQTQGHYKVNSRSQNDDVHVQPLSNVPTKHQLHSLYSFRDIAWIKF